MPWSPVPLDKLQISKTYVYSLCMSCYWVKNATTLLVGEQETGREAEVV